MDPSAPPDPLIHLIHLIHLLHLSHDSFFPQVTVCPPPGSSTALNLDLQAAESVELGEDTREQLVLETLASLHSAHITRFVEDQAGFHTLAFIRAMYDGSQELDFGYTEPSYSYDEVLYPDKVSFKTTLNSEGALGGHYSSPGFGEPITSESARPNAKYTYEAFLAPQVYDPAILDPVLVLELAFSTEPSPTAWGDVPLTKAGEKLTLTKLDYSTSKYTRSGVVARHNLTFPLDDACHFKLVFERDYLEQHVGQPETGFAVTWYLLDGEGAPITEVNADLPNGTWCESLDYADYDDNADDMDVKPLTRWFNILHQYTSVAGLDTAAVWALVRQVKLHQLWKEDAMYCEKKDFELWITSNLINKDIDSLLGELDEGGVVGSEPILAAGDLSDTLWAEGLQMFAHLSYCPAADTEKWAIFWERTLARSPVRGILQKIGHVMVRKAEEQDDISIETGLYEKLAELVPFKSRSALAALSPTQALQEGEDPSSLPLAGLSREVPLLLYTCPGAA
jgi:hypothetical protein